MTTPQEIILRTLNDLGEQEFDKFKWYLYQGAVLEDFKSIPKSQLEGANRFNTVDEMIHTYGTTNAIKVTEKILMKIDRNDLVRKISRTFKEATDAKRDTEQSVRLLLAVRRQRIVGLSDVTVNQLLDRLCEQCVINDGEMNIIRAQIGPDFKARQLIDLVLQKGSDAASVLNTALREVDPSLFRQLNLTQKEQSHAGDGPEGSSRDKDGGSLQIPIIFTPEIQTESAQISYRFSCAGPGVFQCAETGLVFGMTQGAELQYRIVQWDDSRLNRTGKKAAGPMFNIQCSEDAAVHQLHFPHCEADNALRTEGLLSVAHITDDGMDILKPLQITDTHVVVNITQLSLYVLIWHPVERLLKLPVRGQVLLFLRPSMTGPRTFHVFLLQKNIPVSQVAAQQGNAKYIRGPANCVFTTGRSYSLHCEQEVLTIQPESENFYRDFGPDYHPTFEVILTTNPDVVTLNIQDREQKKVWKRTIHLQDLEMDTEQSIQPQSVQPQSVQPQSVQPQSVQPQSVQPQSVQPQSVQPQSVQPQSVQPQRVQPQSVQPHSVQPQSVQPQSVQPQSVQPQSVQPQSVQPQSVQPQSVQPQSVQPQSVQPQSVQPQSVEPQSVQPQSVQPQDWLQPVWTQLIERLSTVNVNQILDRLYQQGVFNEQEMDDVMVEKTAADKARKLITEVQNKGPDAVSCLKTALCEVNPSLCKTLNLL